MVVVVVAEVGFCIYTQYDFRRVPSTTRFLLFDEISGKTCIIYIYIRVRNSHDTPLLRYAVRACVCVYVLMRDKWWRRRRRRFRTFPLQGDRDICVRCPGQWRTVRKNWAHVCPQPAANSIENIISPSLIRMYIYIRN